MAIKIIRKNFSKNGKKIFSILDFSLNFFLSIKRIVPINGAKKPIAANKILMNEVPKIAFCKGVMFNFFSARLEISV